MVLSAMVTRFLFLTFKAQNLWIRESAFSSSLIAAALFAQESPFTTPAGTAVLTKTTLLRVI
jgi:hypothetical protein|tara:strand:+ start:100 stop:285 length:186 start_codon:yes stop_codon:yes gene_type:complete